MQRLFRAFILVAMLGTATFVALWSPDASATVAYDSRYTFEQTFGTALRLLRVDLGCKITEKDVEGGYLLFDYTSAESSNRVHRGSVEVVRTGTGAHVTVQLPSLPQYHEQMIVDALARKLVTEHGEPLPRDKAAPPPADAGADAGP